MFLKGIEAHTEVKKLQLSVHRTVTDLQADSLATYYTLSVTSWTRRPQPLKGGGDGGYGEGVPHDGGEQFENWNAPVSRTN